MKHTTNLLKALAAILATIAGADLTGIINILPADASKWLLMVPTIAAALVHTLKTILDLLDDGEINNSFFLIPLAIGIIALTLPSCANSYQVTNTGAELWPTGETRTIPAYAVTPVLDVPLPSELGGGTLPVPIPINGDKATSIDPTK